MKLIPLVKSISPNAKGTIKARKLSYGAPDQEATSIKEQMVYWLHAYGFTAKENKKDRVIGSNLIEIELPYVFLLFLINLIAFCDVHKICVEIAFAFFIIKANSDIFPIM